MQRHRQPRYSAFQVISFLCHFKSGASLAGTIVHLPIKGTHLFRQVRQKVKLMSIHTEENSVSVSESSLNINIKVVVNVCVSVINAMVFVLFGSFSQFVTCYTCHTCHVKSVLFDCTVTLACCHRLTNFQTLSI